jgi:hypothetical protein
VSRFSTTKNSRTHHSRCSAGPSTSPADWTYRYCSVPQQARSRSLESLANARVSCRFASEKKLCDHVAFSATCAWIFAIVFDNFSTSVSFCALIKSRGALAGTLFFNIHAREIVSACPRKTCMGVLLFSLVDRKLFRTLYTRLTSSGHSYVYIISFDSTARKSRMTYFQADSIVPFDHGRFAVVK